MNRNNFDFLYVIGKGGFGKVWKVKSKKTKMTYALKEMSKLKVIDKKSIKSINSERELLSKLHHPFIVNMHYAFQDNENLYLVMDLLTGGDLRFHISRHKKFSEEQTRFFICGIIFALEYIHSHNIIHRDIKPENLVLDENGYIRLTDFGIAKENMPDNSSETSGTPGYMSPEVMKSMNHSFPADYFALGVIGYEFMKGERPYYGRNRKEIKEQIMSRQAEIKFEDINESWSKESADFINKLLMRKPEQRLGYKGINELKEHPWLKYYPWLLIKDKSLPSPFVPENKDNFDKRYCENIEHIGEETKSRYEELLLDDNYGNYFKNFFYNEEEDKRRNNLDKIINYKSEKENNNSISNINKGFFKRGKNLKQDSNKTISNETYNISKISNLINKADTPNKKSERNHNSNNIKGININVKKTGKAHHIKSGSVCNPKPANMICINFNINNQTNNNIIGNGNNINSFYINNNKSQLNNNIKNNNNIIINNNINNNNIQSDRIKKIFEKKPNNISHNDTNNNNSIFGGVNGVTLSHIHSPLNSAIRRLIKNSKNNSKIKNKNRQSKTKYFHNNSLVKNLSKAYLSQLKTQKSKVRNKNSHSNINNIDIMNLTNKNNSNSINNQSLSRRTFSHSFSNKDFNKKNSQKNISKENFNVNIVRDTNNQNANTISVNEEGNYRSSFKRFSKIPIGRISHRQQKNKYNLKNESLEALIQLSKEKKSFKSKIKSMDKINDKFMDKIKYFIHEIKNNDKNNIDERCIEKTISKNTSSIGNYIYSKRCMLARKQIQFTNPIPSSNSAQKRNKKIKDNSNINNNKIMKGEKGDGSFQASMSSGGGSQLNIFPKNNKNKIISERYLKKKNSKDILFNDKEERKTITINHKDINSSRRSLQRIIPSGITKKIKVNKIINLNS